MRATTQLARVLGEQTAERVAQARVLVVGAGGIGCELLKDLCMSGFRRIHVVDLDTIDLSNLNRQFLFQQRHIKRPKAEVAVQAIRAFNPAIDATAEQANIKDAAYDVDWFARFDLVLNALDNLDARRHVNTMCLAAHVPLIESGTAGYLGQVTAISGGRTECFECRPKPAERKTYPVCTIRSTPSEPIHCIVWAKDYLFARLFGERPDDGNDDDDDQGMSAEEKAENMAELRQLREESRALARLADAAGSADFARRVFDKVFSDDIARLLSMEDMWRQRRPPTRLDYDALRASCGAAFDPAQADDQAVLSPGESLALFAYAADRLAQRLAEQRQQQQQQRFLSFDKDDDDALAFVAATANLRSHAFGIERQSVFAIKAMAGNIIPAIATTNAIVAGMMVMQAMLVLTQRLDECHTAYVAYGSGRARTILREPLAAPNPRCPVCRRRYLTLRVADCAQTTLGDVLRFVRGLAGSARDLGLGEDVSVVEGHRLLYDPDFDDNLARPLAHLGLIPGKMATLASDGDDDDDDDACAPVPVVLSIAAPRAADGAAPEPLSIEGFEHIPEFAPLPKAAAPASSPPSDDGNDDGGVAEAVAELAVDDDGAIVLDEGSDSGGPAVPCASEAAPGGEPHKRKLDEGDQAALKRRAVPGDSGFVVLDE
ncbi:E1 ubiquitin-activating protein uba2 [Coemansia javaensis]|uniref:Ubiquitin-activating enzyme E1-like n=1 Tax=Coemansia javaensis TaxID=2761396 RepID=A0A9W8HF74_9FUNG|nr:E1 ubiquitin-activating protein uba2 [Coemansia javaensis]